MKATGIVRKLDELGRVVIPKEIRKKLNITEGSNIEIYIEENGNLILKKFSPLFNLASLADDFSSALSEKLHINCIITDNEKIVSVKGLSKKEFINKNLTNKFTVELLAQKESIKCKNIKITDCQVHDFLHIAVVPIVCFGIVYGSIILISQNEVNDNNIICAEVISGYLSKLIE